MRQGWAGVALLTFVCGYSSSVCAATAAAAGAAFAMPHRLIDIGGRKMHLYCSGQGATTVVFDAPSGEAGWTWFKVQPVVARQTRACVFDRAGLGFSEPAARPNTSENVAQDLHALLDGAGVKPPFVLVGNSLGGANMQVYAYRYPAQVKALVLVEPEHEDGVRRLDKVSQGRLGKVLAMAAQQNNDCWVAARKGFKPASEELINCIGTPLDTYGAVLGKTVMASTTRPDYWRVAIDELDAIKLSDEQLRKRRRPFGDMPVMVLTRGVSPYAVPGKPQSALNKAMEDENAAIHRETAALSKQGQQRVVAGAGHVIQADNPQAVADAVLEVLRQLK